jgi:hypothetical protein|tara:strand:- start:446 stop:550 length:105 start_codon:yes stop_codon:yes gene_type:complete
MELEDLERKYSGLKQNRTIGQKNKVEQIKMADEY